MLGITASIHLIWGLLFHYFNNLSLQLLEYVFIFLLINIKHECLLSKTWVFSILCKFKVWLFIWQWTLCY